MSDHIPTLKEPTEEQKRDVLYKLTEWQSKTSAESMRVICLAAEEIIGLREALKRYRRDVFHEAADLMDKLWEEQVKERPVANYLSAGLDSAFRRAAIELRRLADPMPGDPKR